MERRKAASNVAFGGVLAALALVIMCLGTMIPVATFICPMLSILLEKAVFQRCGGRVALAWYGAVSVLVVLLAPDKEAAAVFLALGYYPAIKQKLDCKRMKWLWKVLLFNGVILTLYWLLMHIFGMDQIVAEFREMGTVMTVVTLLLGNFTFILLDRLLGRNIWWIK